MRLLLDTHVLLWALMSPQRLNETVRAILENKEHQVLFSAVSIWEIAIKAGLGRQDFTARPERILETARKTGFTELPLSASVAAGVADLPHHHKDPFDRLLVAQAMAEPARLFTADPKLAAYTELVRLVGTPS